MGQIQTWFGLASKVFNKWGLKVRGEVRWCWGHGFKLFNKNKVKDTPKTLININVGNLNLLAKFYRIIGYMMTK
jgi:hypothetical protein